MRSALYWDFTQRGIVASYRRFGTTYRSHLQGSSNQKRKPEHAFDWQIHSHESVDRHNWHHDDDDNDDADVADDDIIIISSIQPLGQFGQEPEPSQATGMALVRCILGKSLGVVCHCFPPMMIYQKN